MEDKKFNLWNRLAALVVTLVSAFTYLSTIEPTASFWDCGEFIASSYKLEVGHPPGNPVFQLFARVATMFGDASHAAVLVNSLSAICSALTIFLLYLTIVFFAKRLFKRGENGLYSTGSAIAVIGSGMVGALAYCFSDTFWFSAVEGEVYAMSSLFTALVIWAMTKWYEQADRPHSNRWIVLISFAMGLSIGIHLLNLLAIPALVFMYYYRHKEEGSFNFKQLIGITALSFVIIAVILFGIVPMLPKIAAYTDLLFVNVLGLPYNTGALFFMVALFALSFWGLFWTMKHDKVLANTVLLCFTTILVGFSLVTIDVVRSCVKTPTNEYQPDNAFTLVRYLSREQYGKAPLVYGQYFDSPYEVKYGKYWAPLNGKYVRADAPADASYDASGKMLFPRMWATSPSGTYESFYMSYIGKNGIRVPGRDYPKPTMGANLRFFFDYQLNWMYWRYFMWNFAGRQNEIHSPIPGDIIAGNWESGIKPIDSFRVGDQSEAPAILSENKGKNHYYMLPLLLGLLGLFFQFDKDKRGSWLVFITFFMTGIAIVLYLNQQPMQVRERDYAYAGSFYAFAIWIGLGVAAVYSWINGLLKNRQSVAVAAVSTAALLCVPAIMAKENWDDHDRSNRYTAVEMAANYLNGVGENGILVTHGDNDTFPLWYAQEVEGIRTDVRIVNTSLLGTDWHIDQMKYAVNESAPLDITVGMSQYLYGTNEIVLIVDNRDEVIPIKDVMTVFKHPEAKVPLQGGKKADYIMSHKISVPVNKVNAVKYGIVSEKFADMIPDEIILEIPKEKDYLSKPDLFMLDLLSNYNWDRPLHLMSNGGDIGMGIKDYLMYDGMTCKFVPFKNKIGTTDPGLVDTDRLYQLMTEVYSWDKLKRTDWFVDYQNMYTFLGVNSQRGFFVSCANAFLEEDEKERAKEALDMCMENVPKANFPYETILNGFSGNDYMVISMAELYYRLGEDEKAREIVVDMFNDLLATARFCLEYYDYQQDNFELCGNYIYFLQEAVQAGGDIELAKRMGDNFDSLLNAYTGGGSADKEDLSI